MPWADEERVQPLGVTLEFWSPTEAEFHFRTLFDRLTENRFSSTAAFINKGNLSRTKAAAHD
jgi:hypothetical protein